MRKRRRILLIDSREIRRSVTRFVLWHWKYSITSAGSVKEAVCLLGRDRFDLVMGYAPIPEQSFAMAACSRDVPSLMICARLDAKVRGLADRTLLAPSMADVIEAVRSMTVRKPGPKKWTKRVLKKPVRSVPLAEIFPGLIGEVA
jgi:CheY-like chemotaxis protein